MASTACIPPAPAPGDAVGLRERARGALLGLAVGDALGAPAENMKPSEIRARWGRITGYVAAEPAGTDDTEYAIFSGLLLARYGSALTAAHVEAAWHEWIADREEGPFRGAGFSERGTLENLRRGLAAPISAQHRHAWSDGLAMRAAPHGVFAAGRPAEAARLVAIDGSVSHDGEGIHGGQAVAAGVAAAMAGAPTDAVVASALAVVPEDSWTARCLRRAMTAAHLGERAVRSAVVIGGYPWTDLAPEAVALAFGAYAAADGDFTEAVLTAVNMGRDADTTAAVAGALAGAARGAAAIPAEWASAIGPARGSCLPSMAGHHVLDVADLLARAAQEARTARPRASAGARTAGGDGVPDGHGHAVPTGPPGDGHAPGAPPSLTAPAPPASAGTPGDTPARTTVPPGTHADAARLGTATAGIATARTGTLATATDTDTGTGTGTGTDTGTGTGTDTAPRRTATADTTTAPTDTLTANTDTDTVTVTDTSANPATATRTDTGTATDTRTHPAPHQPPTPERDPSHPDPVPAPEPAPSAAGSPGAGGDGAPDAGNVPRGRPTAPVVGPTAVRTGGPERAPARDTGLGAHPGDQVVAEVAP
ncbi:ADP-ribosylglycohydrolase family protein [Streptomyces rochei]|uniref:ADP-ribosylglycohydrolase family protein n=1 Tax=Streptomyces rochei TaxID=1928 RepID=UPI0036517826